MYSNLEYWARNRYAPYLIRTYKNRLRKRGWNTRQAEDALYHVKRHLLRWLPNEEVEQLLQVQIGY